MNQELTNPRLHMARYMLGVRTAITGEEWGGLFKNDPAWQEGYTDGLSHSMDPEPKEVWADDEEQIAREASELV